MKRFLVLVIILYSNDIYGQVPISLGKTAHVDDMYFYDSSGNATVPDHSGPGYCTVRKNSSETPLSVSGAVTLFSTGTTNRARFEFAMSSGNGFAIDDDVQAECYATVGGLNQGLGFGHWVVKATENTAGFLPVDVSRINNISTSGITAVNANLGTTQPENFTGTGASALLKTDVVDFGGSAGTISGGIPAVNLTQWRGSTPNVLISGRPDVDVGNNQANVITAASINANAIGASELATDAAQEIRDEVWNAATKILTAATNITSTGGTITVSAGAVTVGTNNDKTGYSLSGTQTFNNTGTWTGNITGNLSGSVGSVTGNIGGNVVGSVSSVTGLTNTTIANLVWDTTLASHLTAGTTGAALNSASSAGDPWATAIPGAYSSGTAGYILGNQVVRTSTNNRPLDVNATGGASIDWGAIDNPTTSVNFSGTTISTSQAVASVSGAVGSVTGNVGGNIVGVVSAVTGLTNTTIANLVWDTTLASHLGVGSTGEALNAAGSAGDPWTTALPGAYGAGSAGYIVGNQLVRTTVNNRTLDVNANGNAGIDWGNVDAPTTTLNLSGTTVSAVSGAVGSVTGNVGGNVTGSVGSVTGLTLAGITGGVWDVVLGSHLTPLTTGSALNAASSAGDPWATALPGAYGAGTAGHILGRIPDIAAGASGGLFIAGSNAATTVNITGNLSGSVGSVTGSVGSVTGNVAGNVVGSIGSVATGGITNLSFASGAIDSNAAATDFIGAAELSSAAVDKIWAKTLSQLSQATPAATPAASDALMGLWHSLRDTVIVTKTGTGTGVKKYTNDAGTVIFKKNLLDDGTTLTESEAVAGP